MIFRDDDINKYTDIGTFLKVHSLFEKYKKLHTVAVEMEGLWENKELWYILVTTPNIQIGLHGWTHLDYSKMPYNEICDSISKSLNYWKSHIIEGYGSGVYQGNKIIRTFYPPWNRVSEDLKRACAACELSLDSRTSDGVYNFHYWACIEERYMKDLEQMLSKE